MANLDMSGVCGGKTALVGQIKLAGKSIGKELQVQKMILLLGSLDQWNLLVRL